MTLHDIHNVNFFLSEKLKLALVHTFPKKKNINFQKSDDSRSSVYPKRRGIASNLVLPKKHNTSGA